MDTKLGSGCGPNTNEFLGSSAIDCRVFWVAGGTVETRLQALDVPGNTDLHRVGAYWSGLRAR